MCSEPYIAGAAGMICSATMSSALASLVFARILALYITKVQKISYAAPLPAVGGRNLPALLKMMEIRGITAG